ncbi:acetyl-CoA carboxylase biotin carboxylase subunit [Bradyrhizobium sp. JR3.5]
MSGTIVKRTPFFKILIANRGEIALRIMRTARRLGYGVVAVYSDADRDALHVREADQAVRIGEALPAQSYLKIDEIIAAAKASGAGAVHPGYGFLAENEDFAQACRDAGLVFIGPSPEAILTMGNKAGAKEIMQKAGVPCVPGYQGADQSDAVMLAEAKAIGFPVMIKAVAGGGGRGMRLVADAAAFPDALRSARSEAQGAFGDPTVILERAIVDPRHIEIQVFGDRYGNAVHLGERDCSVQRRHQKLIEEAPSPAVTPELRARMGAVAVQAVKAIGYEGAGTLEFLLDRTGNFYFMEMNTRLQVEHPVTEAITGLDLVELQLRVASGERLGLRQEDITFSGHAIEVRLCSEDAGHDFMPQSGTMARWQVPEGIRVEHALQSGSEIPSFYDSMIAKVISHGAIRDESRGKLICALEQVTAFGVTTNQGFLIDCLRHPVFAKGEATTAFIGNNRDTLLASPARSRQRPRARGAAALCHQSARAAMAARPLAVGDIPARLADRSRSRRAGDRDCPRARRQLPRGSQRRSLQLRDRRTRSGQHPFPPRWFDGAGQVPARRRSAPYPASWRHSGSARSDARAAGERCGRRWRRQGPCGDERPGRRGAGEGRRQGRGRPTGADAGGDEDGARAYGGCRGHGVVDRRCRGRAGDDGEDRGGDRGGGIATVVPGKPTGRREAPPDDRLRATRDP